jgi:hypothetical protein
MDDDFKLVDDYFCRICDLPDLDPSSRALVEVYHSFGLIQNGGFHNYLCALGDDVSVVAEQYRKLGLMDGFKAITAAHSLWRAYWPELPPDESDSQEFRERFGPQLNVIEESFYALDSTVIAKLATIVRERQLTN